MTIKQKGDGMKTKVQDIRLKFPGVPVEDYGEGRGFILYDRPYHPDAVVRILKNELDINCEHVGGYVFLWKEKT